MSNLTKIFVTGGSGFIGKYLVQNFHATPIKREKNSFLLSREMSGAVCIHLAGSNLNTSEVNFDHLLEEAKSYYFSLLEADFKKIIFISSAAVYGDRQEKPRTELSDLDPRTSYSKVKVEIEKIVLKKKENIIVRLANVYGHGMSDKNVVSNLLRQAAQNNSVIKMGNLKAIRDFIHIDDVCEAIFSLASIEKATGIFNVATGVSYSIRELTALFKKIANQEFELIGSEDAERSMIYLSIDKIKKELNWNPKVHLDFGLKKMIERSGI